VNAGDDEAAARMFAGDARVVEAGSVRRLRTFDEAHAWHLRLRCSRRVVRLRSQEARVRATFLLGDRGRNGSCARRGMRADELFRVRNGKIVLWHELELGGERDDESA